MLKTMKRTALACAFLAGAASAWHVKVELRSVSTGDYVNVTSNSVVKATGTAPMLWTLIDHNAGLLRYRDTISLKSPRGQFMVAENGGDTNDPVLANRAVPGPWEKFFLLKSSTVGFDSIVSGDTVVLKSFHGRLLSVSSGWRRE